MLSRTALFGRVSLTNLRWIRSCSSVGPDRVLPATNLVSTDPLKPVKLRMDDSEVGSREPFSIQTMFRRTVERFPDHNAMQIRRNGEWVKYTFTDYYSNARTLAKAFKALGLERGHGVGILGFNCPEWFMANYGTIFAGGLVCGLYVTSSSDVIQYICGHAPVDIMLVETNELLNTAMGDHQSLKEAFPNVKAFAIWEEDPKIDGVLSWDQLLTIGEEQSDEVLKKAEEEQSINQACILSYTSGTTGHPKGVLLSHDNITFTAVMMTEIFCEGVEIGTEYGISFLPANHIASSLLDIYLATLRAGFVTFAGKDALKGKLIDYFQEMKPCRVFAVPRVFEKIHERMLDAESKMSGIQRPIFQWAKYQASAHHEAMRNGADPTGSVQYRLAKRILKKVHMRLGFEDAAILNGGIGTGAAALPLETEKYFESIDLHLMQVYGATETTGSQTTNRWGPKSRVGSVGMSYPGVYHKLVDVEPESGRGHLACTGRVVFMGYLRDEAKTAEVIDKDGWYLTGDIAEIDENGFVTITGRQKEIIVTSSGKNIAPLPIEDRIKAELPEVVSYAVVVGEGRNFITCILTLRVMLDIDTLLPTDKLDPVTIKWAESIGVKGVTTVKEFLNGPKDLFEAIQAGIDRANEKADSNPFKVRKWCLLPRDFSIPTGELGPTLKLKRNVIAEKYAKEINKMYC